MEMVDTYQSYLPTTGLDETLFQAGRKLISPSRKPIGLSICETLYPGDPAAPGALRGAGLIVIFRLPYTAKVRARERYLDPATDNGPSRLLQLVGGRNSCSTAQPIFDHAGMCWFAQTVRRELVWRNRHEPFSDALHDQIAGRNDEGRTEEA